MKKSLLILHLLLLSLTAEAQEYYEDSYQSEEEFYEGEQINLDAYSPEELQEIERQEEEIEYVPNEDFIHEEDPYWEYNDYQSEEYHQEGYDSY